MMSLQEFCGGLLRADASIFQIQITAGIGLAEVYAQLREAEGAGHD